MDGSSSYLSNSGDDCDAGSDDSMSRSEGESEYVLVRDRYLVVTLLLLPTVTTVMRPTTRVMNWSARGDFLAMPGLREISGMLLKSERDQDYTYSIALNLQKSD